MKQKNIIIQLLLECCRLVKSQLHYIINNKIASPVFTY
uniref:Uncharacterized protein n=1 Tax=Arundo donax TaxID=35708 RepID=A0A0A9BTK2_ARUDO